MCPGEIRRPIRAPTSGFRVRSMRVMMPADGFELITFIPIGYVENDFDSSGQWEQME